MVNTVLCVYVHVTRLFSPRQMVYHKDKCLIRRMSVPTEVFGATRIPQFTREKDKFRLILTRRQLFL